MLKIILSSTNVVYPYNPVTSVVLRAVSLHVHTFDSPTPHLLGKIFPWTFTSKAYPWKHPSSLQYNDENLEFVFNDYLVGFWGAERYASL